MSSFGFTRMSFPPELVHPRTFIFLGKLAAAAEPDYDLILDDFDRLLPLYRFVEGHATFPSLSDSRSTARAVRASRRQAVRQRPDGEGEELSTVCLVASGFALLATSLVAVPLALLLAIAGAKGTSAATAAHLARAKSDAVAHLEGIAGLSPDVVAEFRRDGRIREETIAALPIEQRAPVRQVVIDYGIAVGSTGAAGAVVGGLGTLAVVGLLVFGIPGAIIGLLLVRGRKLWRCGACGFVFEHS
jgi:hypothetical protein